MNLKDKNTDDSLGREKIAKQYVSLLDALDGNYVIALDAPWGSGKTTLLELMADELKDKSLAYINYNAWKNDYLEDPFLSLISEFNSQVTKKEYLPILDKLSGLKEVSYQASKRILPSVIKGATQFFIGNDAVKELENGGREIVSSLVNSSSSTIDEVFKNIDESKISRENFTKKLTEIVDDIRDTSKYKKVIFIIDELDRCKPTFAIELLENIKHLFDIKNVIFLISVDKQQLSESIKSVYGSGFDSMGYLKRFFNFNLHLKFSSDNDFIQVKYKSFFKHGEIKDIGGKDSIVSAFDLLNLSLRDYEQVLAELFLLHEISNAFNQELYFLLLCIKHKNYELYRYISDSRNQQHINIKDEMTQEYGRALYNLVHRQLKDELSNELFSAIDTIESTVK